LEEKQSATLLPTVTELRQNLSSSDNGISCSGGACLSQPLIAQAKPTSFSATISVKIL